MSLVSSAIMIAVISGVFRANAIKMEIDKINGIAGILIFCTRSTIRGAFAVCLLLLSVQLWRADSEKQPKKFPHHETAVRTNQTDW